MLVNPVTKLETLAPIPSKLNAGPTSPAANPTPPTNIPLFDPMMSFALPSPVHQSTNPDGAGVQSVCARRTGGTNANVAKLSILRTIVALDLEKMPCLERGSAIVFIRRTGCYGYRPSLIH